jgi:lipid II:glycine glycyltransferase (peptidoglycan interpeptide bridge formation enzyme)
MSAPDPTPALRQTDAWAHFMETIGWQTTKIGRTLLLVKPFPFRLGSFIKILDLDHQPDWQAVGEECRKRKCRKLHLQTVFLQKSQEAGKLAADLRKYAFSPTAPLSPSKTIIINLKKGERAILADMRRAKRAAIRQAKERGVQVEISDQIGLFARFWQAQMRRKGDWLAGTKEIIALKQAFGNRIYLLTARSGRDTDKLRAGVLLLRGGTTLHYSHAASTSEGNHLRAPALLVWESLKLGQKLGCARFDFGGVQDPRFIKQQKSWQGFSRFKSGFGGQETVYLTPYAKTFVPFPEGYRFALPGSPAKI